jgi:hypothetical protein
MPKIRVHQDLILDTAEIGGALIVIAVLIGQISLPMYYGVSTSGWSTETILVFQAVIIVAIAALVMGIVRKIRKYT